MADSFERSHRARWHSCCVISPLGGHVCQRRKRLNAPVQTSALARHQARRRASSSARKCITSVKASMAPCVHSVQPRDVYRPLTVKTGVPFAGSQAASIARILCPASSKTRAVFGRSRCGVRRALKREGHRAASRKALSRQAKTAARRRSPASRSAAARKAARTRQRRASA